MSTIITLLKVDDLHLYHFVYLKIFLQASYSVHVHAEKKFPNTFLSVY